ncbi:uncharacterized protein J7T54_003383 [Emericellopsis cladophorae]|uniref:Uncharacterized protein n=1 Tax=Emericellopsis cladophorae TaxID=2686198 RepID=A0A9P9XWG0_9HYPO|nr:uncharacterized protein J7T54_003383 [Emericellopsis cladophorae]KAI6778604.1 hypothetical protein J7T54_003383 [Emericellopsis cladophorae]
MYSMNHLTSALLMATSVLAAPQPEMIEKRHPVDFVGACEMFRPAPNELGLLTAGGVELAWDGNNLGNKASDKAAVLFDPNCNIISSTHWRPMSPGFSIEWTWDEGLVISAKTPWIGYDITPPTIWVNGEEPYKLCMDTQHKMNGLNAGDWRSCNFQHNGLYGGLDVL